MQTEVWRTHDGYKGRVRTENGLDYGVEKHHNGPWRLKEVEVKGVRIRVPTNLLPTAGMRLHLTAALVELIEKEALGAQDTVLKEKRA